MKIVHSLWTVPALAAGPLLDHRGGWPTRELYWYSWALSCLQAKATQGRIELVTDSAGAEILVDRLGLPYDSVTTVLDTLSVHGGLWAYGKIAAYGLQEEPFLHIDADVYLWKPLPEQYRKASIVVQSLEFGPMCDFEYYYGYYYKQLVENLKVLPASFAKFAHEQSAFCAAVLGGNDLVTIKDYVREVQRLVESPDNRAGWETIFNRGLGHVQWYNCAVEQLTAYCVFNDLGKWPMPLLFQDDFGPESKRADEIGYTHVSGSKYNDDDLHQRLIARMRRDYPHIVEAVARLLA